MNRIKNSILESLNEMTIIDAHEHLRPEMERLKLTLDVFAFFGLYLENELYAAGLPNNAYEWIFEPEVPLEERWKYFSPFWEKVRFTPPARACLIAAREHYGFDDINDKNYKEISSAIQADNTPGVYDRLLRQKCRIEKILSQFGCMGMEHDPNDPLILRSAESLMPPSPLATYKDFTSPPPQIAKYFPDGVSSIDEFLDRQKRYYRQLKHDGFVGVKTIVQVMPYPYQPPVRARAEKIFENLKSGKIDSLPVGNELFRYLLDESIRLCSEENLVIAVHAGGICSNGDPRNVRSIHLVPMLQRHPKAKFDIYHMGYPYCREWLWLAKCYPNAYVNFCWGPILSGKAAVDTFEEAIELPINKVLAFGADYHAMTAQNVYGQLVMAREFIAEAMSRKVASGWFSLNEALMLAKRWLYHNPKDLYGLK